MKYLHSLFQLAGIKGGHAHRFRDTFAVELLLKGVPIERVSVLLGHGSVKITERHYSPWVRARQEQLEADVKRTWGEDPILFSETKGTSEVTLVQIRFWLRQFGQHAGGVAAERPWCRAPKAP